MKMPQTQSINRAEEPLLIREKECLFRYGMGRTKFRAWAEEIGAKVKIGSCSLYIRDVLDRAVLDQAPKKGEAVHDN